MKKYNKVTKEQIAEIHLLKKKGMTIAGIHSKLGINEQTIRYYYFPQGSIKKSIRDGFVREKIPCKTCGHIVWKERKLSGEERTVKEIETAQRVLKRAREMGLI